MSKEIDELKEKLRASQIKTKEGISFNYHINALGDIDKAVEITEKKSAERISELEKDLEVIRSKFVL